MKTPSTYNRHRIALSVAVLSGASAIAGTAHAQAFYLQEQAARAAGRAFSGETADTGAASLWWNPAAIAGIDRAEATVSASAILPSGDVIDNGTAIRRPGGTFAPVGGSARSRDPINKGVLPSGAIAVPLGDRLAVGLAVTSPYSFTTDYPGDSWARYSADRTYLRTFDIQPSAAIAVTDWLRVGGAVNVEHVEASLGNALPNLSAALADGNQTLKGDGWDVGWSAGFQMHNDWATVGVSYKSAIEHTLKGDLTVSGLLGPLATQNRSLNGVEARFYTPAQIMVGGRFKVSDALTLNAQTIRYTWEKFDAIRLGAPVNAAIPENYRSTWSYAGGFDYLVSPRLTLRAGVQRALTPTRDGERDARVPDSNRWNYAVGGSFDVTPNFTIDAAANYVDFADTTIDRRTAAYAGTAAQTPILVNGRLENAKAVVLSLGGRVRF
ncbi:OmpP1/FadL family transporter [Sphingomonas endophytica]|uniref:Aromatic hydrocarbon degradation protein n=1 Tax=Sphingomonas endophytica TaxID=869719 RepID=A0A147HYX6_9SPHN|nr:outer membrane protein transport protein [Sphingomonas endophytica]KTT70215.1 aromatic hydrocarbon degradation protein [Sphingomonas endophytica]